MFGRVLNMSLLRTLKNFAQEQFQWDGLDFNINYFGNKSVLGVSESTLDKSFPIEHFFDKFVQQIRI